MQYSSLDLSHPAVDEQFDARDETAVVGGEEQGDLRDLVGLAKPALCRWRIVLKSSRFDRKARN
jgi:hypothetical protein